MAQFGFGGSLLLEQLVKVVEDNIDPEDNYEDLVKIFTGFINLVEENGGDDLEECKGISDALDEALKNIYPEWFDEG